MGATLRQIARESSVSISTVSRALSNHPYVDKQTRARVKEVAERLNYRPSLAGRALRGLGTHTVGVVLPDMMNHFYARTVSILQDQLEDRGYGVTFAVTNNDIKRERDALERLASAYVDGVIIVPVIARNPPEPPDMAIVELNRISSRKVDKISYDETVGAYQLTKHLVNQGHRAIAYIGGNDNFTTTRNRLNGFFQALKEADIPSRPELLQCRSYTRSWGARATSILLDLDDPPTAVFSSSSEVTLGFLTTAHGRGLSLPDDMSLVSFGDPEWYEVVVPAITSYKQPIATCASLAVQMLTNRMADPNSTPTKITVEGEISYRNSVGSPRQ